MGCTSETQAQLLHFHARILLCFCLLGTLGHIMFHVLVGSWFKFFAPFYHLYLEPYFVYLTNLYNFYTLRVLSGGNITFVCEVFPSNLTEYSNKRKTRNFKRVSMRKRSRDWNIRNTHPILSLEYQTIFVI